MLQSWRMTADGANFIGLLEVWQILIPAGVNLNILEQNTVSSKPCECLREVRRYWYLVVPGRGIKCGTLLL